MPVPHKVTIEHIGKGRYRVHHDGRILIEATRQPEFDACRALLALGITGRLETWRRNLPYRCTRLDIERAAKRTVIENANEGPRFAKWAPFVEVDVRNALSCRSGSQTSADIELEAA